jgi:Erv1 / Alr family
MMFNEKIMSNLSQLTVKPPRIRYPQTEPKEWGQHYWYFFHENASLYPEQPTPEDVSKEQEHINYFITHLPCKQSCEPNAAAYVQQNPPDLTSRKAYFTWTIAFHNAINQETGSEERIDNPDDLLGEGACDSCVIPGRPGNTDTSQGKTGGEVSHDSDAKFAASVREYKDAVRKLIIDAYKKEGKDPPDQIIFSRCGDGTDTSCAMVIDGKHYTFYHPRDIFKTLFHEVDHHIDARSGKKIDDSLNGKADKYATEMIEKHSPFEKVIMDKKGNILVAHDTTIIRDSVPIPSGGGGSAATNPQALVQEVYGQPNSFTGDVNDPRILNDFPHLKQTLMEIKKEELKNEIRDFEQKGGVLSHFDRVYETPANWTGLKAQDLNLIHTPTILNNVIMTLTGSYLSPLSKTALTGIMGVVLMLVGLAIHARIPTRDVQLIQALGSQLTWGSAIPSLNPKNARRIKYDFFRLGDKIKERKFHVGDLIETPNQEETAFKPTAFNPQFDTFDAFGATNKGGKPIPQTDRVSSSGSEVRNPDYWESRGGRSDAVIRLPKFSSRSHNRFF